MNSETSNNLFKIRMQYGGYFVQILQYNYIIFSQIMRIKVAVFITL